MVALAAFSQDQLLNILRSAALLSPIAYVGQMTSPLAKNAAENFIAEVLVIKCFDCLPKEKILSKIQKINTENLCFPLYSRYTILGSLNLI